MIVVPTYNGLGLSFKNEDITVTNHSGFTFVAGSYAPLDLTRSTVEVQALSDPKPYGVRDGMFSTVRLVLNIAEDGASAGCILLQDVVDGATGRARIRGRCTAVIGSSAAASAGDSVGIDAAVNPFLQTDHAVTAKALGILLEDYAGSANIATEILFDGINGFGLP